MPARWDGLFPAWAALRGCRSDLDVRPLVVSYPRLGDARAFLDRPHVPAGADGRSPEQRATNAAIASRLALGTSGRAR